jgi:hypothetical protein
VAVATLVFALVLRLAWVVPAPADEARSFAAAFGEHALCLATPPSDETTPAGPRGDGPPAPGGHAGHDDAKCCQWHATGWVVLPGTGATTLVAFATPSDRLEHGATPARRSIARAQARAPPLLAS